METELWLTLDPPSRGPLRTRDQELAEKAWQSNLVGRTGVSLGIKFDLEKVKDTDAEMAHAEAALVEAE